MLCRVPCFGFGPWALGETNTTCPAKTEASSPKGMLSALTDSMLRSPDILLFTINLTPCRKISKAARCVNGQLQAAAWKWIRTKIPGSTREFKWKERAVGLCFYYVFFSWIQVNTPVFWCYVSNLLDLSGWGIFYVMIYLLLKLRNMTIWI